MGTEFTDKNLKIYTINYLDLKRNLSIIFEEQFSFKMVDWKQVNEGKIMVGVRK